MRIIKHETLHCNAGWRDFSFLKIYTNEGVTGISEYNECYGSMGLSNVIRNLMANIISMDPIQNEKIHQLLYAITRQVAGGITQQAIAAIENAILDIKGKIMNVPVHTLLGGTIRNKLKLYWSHCGTYRISSEYSEIMKKSQIKSLENLVELGKEVSNKGFKALKTNIFNFNEESILQMQGFGRVEGWPELNVSTATIDSLIKQILALREGAGKDVEIHLDLNFNFKIEGYLKIVRALDHLSLAW